MAQAPNPEHYVVGNALSGLGRLRPPTRWVCSHTFPQVCQRVHGLFDEHTDFGRDKIVRDGDHADFGLPAALELRDVPLRERRDQAPSHCAGIVTMGAPSLPPVSTSVKRNMRNENRRFEGMSWSSMANQWLR
jgi:hypothetical protein